MKTAILTSCLGSSLSGKYVFKLQLLEFGANECSKGLPLMMWPVLVDFFYVLLGAGECDTIASLLGE